MPPVRSISIQDNMVVISDHRGTRTLLASDIPKQFNDATKIENYVNNTWIPANIADYQMRVKIFSLNPLRMTVWTANIGAPIPANWWVDG